MKLKFFLVMFFLLISLIGIDKANQEGNMFMEGVCSFGAFITFFVGVIFWLQYQIDKIDLK